VSRRTSQRGSGKQWVEGKRFRLADEVRYIQNKAAEHDGRVVTLGQLLLFSTDTGDAWLLDVTDQLAARLARDGDPEPIPLEETDTSFAIGWKGRYHIGWDRSRARPAVGGGFPLLLFRLQGGFTIPPWRRFPKPPYNAGRPNFSGPV
jgi:hypothetical protein